MRGISEFKDPLVKLVGKIRDHPGFANYIPEGNGKLRGAYLESLPRSGWDVLWKHFGRRHAMEIKNATMEEIVCVADQILREDGRSRDG